jgi:hypothetical protein
MVATKVDMQKGAALKTLRSHHPMFVIFVKKNLRKNTTLRGMSVLIQAISRLDAGFVSTGLVMKIIVSGMKDDATAKNYRR